MSEHEVIYSGGRRHGRRSLMAAVAALHINSGESVRFLATDPVIEEQMRQDALAQCEELDRIRDGQ